MTTPNQRACPREMVIVIEDAGLLFIPGARIPDIPYVVTEWRREDPDTEISDGQIFVQPWPAARG
jgi:hypothetical protein